MEASARCTECIFNSRQARDQRFRWFPKGINDVLVGDVWFASGQSNMEMQVACVEGGPAALAEPHAEALRLFTVSRFLENSAAPMGSNWAPSNSNSAAEMSAVAWFFGGKSRRVKAFLSASLTVVLAVRLQRPGARLGRWHWASPTGRPSKLRTSISPIKMNGTDVTPPPISTYT